MRMITWLVTFVGVACMIAGAASASVPKTSGWDGIVETAMSLPNQPANVLVVFGVGVALLFLALYMRSKEE